MIGEGVRESVANIHMAEVLGLMEEKHRSFDRMIAELDGWPEPRPEAADG